jgi:hypothetical protein
VSDRAAPGGPPAVLERDAEALLEPHPPLSVPIPAYGGRSLPNIAATIVRALGRRLDPPVAIVPPLVDALDPFGGRPAEGPIVQVLVDGLGWADFRRWAGSRRRPPGDAWWGAARPITTVFPSTTTSALFSLATACAPGQHGLLGYRQYLPRFGVVADMLKLSPVGVEERDLLVGPRWRPESLGGPPTLARRGLPMQALTRDRFLATGFTRLVYDGSELTGYATATDLAHELGRLLAGGGPRLVSVYWDELDTIQHLKGIDPRLIDLEIERTIQLVEHVAEHLPLPIARATMLLLTGDHGQVPAVPEARVAVDEVDAIARELLRPPTGDRRCGFFSARPGRVEALRTALEVTMPPGTRILELPAALEAGLFGPPPYHPEARERLGDLLVLPRSPSTIAYRSPGMAAPARFLYGAHGGLEPAELLVPLVAGPLAAFRPGADASEQR